MKEKTASDEGNLDSPTTSDLLKSRVDETKAKCDQLREQVIRKLLSAEVTQAEIDLLKLVLTISVKPLLEFSSLNDNYLGMAVSLMQEKHVNNSAHLPIFSFGGQVCALNSRDLYHHVFSQIRTLSQ